MCHVLIIEDEPLIAMDLQDLLEAAGATSFDLACSQDEAIAAALERLPAFITSDVALLNGTGPCAVAIIQQRIGKVPVIFITGTPDACKPCGQADRIMTKPFNRTALAQAFREMVWYPA
jgi:CheY-like chemotaxis protein